MKAILTCERDTEHPELFFAEMTYGVEKFTASHGYGKTKTEAIKNAMELFTPFTSQKYGRITAPEKVL